MVPASSGRALRRSGSWKWIRRPGLLLSQRIDERLGALAGAEEVEGIADEQLVVTRGRRRRPTVQSELELRWRTLDGLELEAPCELKEEDHRRIARVRGEQLILFEPIKATTDLTSTDAPIRYPHEIERSEGDLLLEVSKRRCVGRIEDEESKIDL